MGIAIDHNLKTILPVIKEVPVPCCGIHRIFKPRAEWEERDLVSCVGKLQDLLVAPTVPKWGMP